MNRFFKIVVLSAALSVCATVEVGANGTHYAKIAAEVSESSPTGSGLVYIDGERVSSKQNSNDGESDNVRFTLEAKARKDFYFCGWSNSADACKYDELERSNPWGIMIQSNRVDEEYPEDGGTYYAVFAPCLPLYFSAAAVANVEDAGQVSAFIDDIVYTETSESSASASADASFVLNEIAEGYVLDNWTYGEAQYGNSPYFSADADNSELNSEVKLTATASFSKSENSSDAPELGVGNIVSCVGYAQQLSVTLPDESEGWTVSYTTADDNIASVDGNGKVTGKQVGVTFVTVAITKNEIVRQVAARVEVASYLDIEDADDYKQFVGMVNAGGNSLDGFLLADIDVSELGNDACFSNSASYSGVFDGGGHTLTVNLTDHALVGNLSGTICNLKVAGDIASNVQRIAGIVSKANPNSYIENCISAVSIQSGVEGDAFIGGICGQTDGAVIRNCGFVGTINGETSTKCGGIVGEVNGSTEISHCYVTASFNTASEGYAAFTGNDFSGCSSCFAIEGLANLQGGEKCSQKDVKDGTLCVGLNSGNTYSVWRQNLSGSEPDMYPVPFEDHMIVYNIDEFCSNTSFFIIGDDIYHLNADNDIYTYEGDVSLSYNQRYKTVVPFTTSSLTYSFPIAADAWTPWFVPFSITTDELEENNLTAAVIAGVRQYEKDEEGNIQTQVDILKIRNARLRPGTPYLVRSSENVAGVFINMENVEMSLHTDVSEVNTSTAMASYDFIGTYSRIVSDDFDPEYKYYIMSNGALGITDSYVPSIYWYMKAKSKDPMYDELPVSGVIKVCIVGEENGTTGVRTIYPVEQQSTEVYDLSGMRQQGLNSGMINIVNGKKYLVK